MFVVCKESVLQLSTCWAFCVVKRYLKVNVIGFLTAISNYFLRDSSQSLFYTPNNDQETPKSRVYYRQFHLTSAFSLNEHQTGWEIENDLSANSFTRSEKNSTPYSTGPTSYHVMSSMPWCKVYEKSIFICLNITGPVSCSF